MPAYYCSTLAEFSAQEDDKIITPLILVAGTANLGNHFHAQTRAWQAEIAILRAAAGELLRKGSESNRWGLLLEYPIPRRQKRIDAVLLAGENVLVLEF